MYPGNYTFYLQKKAERLEKEQKDTHIMKQLYRRELSRVKKAPRARATKSVKREKDFFALQDTYYDKKETLAHNSKKIEIASSDKSEEVRL
jgi:ATP-binding cassette subfamily F protein uup